MDKLLEHDVIQQQIEADLAKAEQYHRELRAMIEATVKGGWAAFQETMEEVAREMREREAAEEKRKAESKAPTQQEIREAIRDCVITENSVQLPDRELRKPLYAAVKRVLENAGGQWSKTARMFVFSRDPRADLENYLSGKRSSNYKKAFQEYYTPPEAAQFAVSLAGVRGSTVLEPSAGAGALVKECLRQGAEQVTAIELRAECGSELSVLAHTTARTGEDFLTITGLPQFDRVVMNPPFKNKAWEKHLLHALGFLAPGGRLVCVAPDKRDHINALPLPGGFTCEVHPLPDGAFKASGTMVPTVVIVIQPAEADCDRAKRLKQWRRRL